MAAIAGYNGAFYLSGSTSTAFATEAMTDSGDHTNYQITNAAHRYWDRGTVPQVQTSPDGTTWTTVTTGFTIQYVGGFVRFATAQAAGTQVKVNNGKYWTVSAVGDCKEWDMTADTTMVDTTTFGSAWRNQAEVQHLGSITVNKWWIDATFLTQLGNLFVVSLYINTTTNQRYECYAYLKTSSVKTPATNMIDQTLSFEMDGQLYYFDS